MIPTPHIEVSTKGVIAPTVLMPGDPLRAKKIAELYLENVVQFNSVRGMLGFTGEYKGKKISVMGSGMGMPSIGIYSYELYSFYGVENIIRVGSCGSYDASLNVYDVMICEDAWSESSYAKTQSGLDDTVIAASPELVEKLKKSADKLGIGVHVGRIHSSDVFYRENSDFRALAKQTGSKAVEMESFALYANAKLLGKHAACIVTVSDSFVTGDLTSAEQRQNSFTKMMEIALNA